MLNTTISVECGACAWLRLNVFVWAFVCNLKSDEKERVGADESTREKVRYGVFATRCFHATHVLTFSQGENGKRDGVVWRENEWNSCPRRKEGCKNIK